jgi:fluoride exporter
MILLATVAGAVGALSRYVLSGFVQERIDSDLPIGTLAVNLTGAFLLGLVVGVDQLGSAATLTAAGFLGGFTTFSTWMIEAVRLGIPPLRARALINLAVTLVAGVALAAAGYTLTN